MNRDLIGISYFGREVDRYSTPGGGGGGGIKTNALVGHRSI